MPSDFSTINVSKARQLRPIKIDYSHIRNLEYIDKNNLKPQTFAEYRRLFVPGVFVTEEQARPAF